MIPRASLPVRSRAGPPARGGRVGLPGLFTFATTGIKMQRLQVLGFVGLLAGTAALYGWARTRSGAPSGSTGGPAAPVLVSSPSHMVSPQMAEASRGMVERQAMPFELTATDGKTYALADLLRKGPVVLTFTKVGCPCSEAAQPLFNRVAAAYPRASVLGVVNAESGPASLWTRRLSAQYPHLLDPDLRLVRDFGVENSAYVVVVDPSGRIVEHWPGISQEMLRDLGAKLARLTGSREAHLDVTEAPDELYSGCPYDF